MQFFYITAFLAALGSAAVAPTGAPKSDVIVDAWTERNFQGEMETLNAAPDGSCLSLGSTSKKFHSFKVKEGFECTNFVESPDCSDGQGETRVLAGQVVYTPKPPQSVRCMPQGGR